MPNLKKKQIPLSRAQEIYVEEVATHGKKTLAKNIAGYSSTSSTSNIESDSVLEAIKRRKMLAAKNNNITPEMIVGKLAQIAFAPTDEFFDERGQIDFAKLKEYGEQVPVKKMSVKQTKFGENIEVEFYSALEAVKTLGNYVGLERLTPATPPTVEKFVRVARTVAEKNNLSEMDVLRLAVKNGRFPAELFEEIAAELAKNITDGNV